MDRHTSRHHRRYQLASFAMSPDEVRHTADDDASYARASRAMGMQVIADTQGHVRRYRTVSADTSTDIPRHHAQGGASCGTSCRATCGGIERHASVHRTPR
ncbi:hypothetical protein [Pseudoxanthomonas japonensis]|uniref:hypothetical protein n=1 Tax=Pseudoxanthomonas japonensis TaxID=69284 RepID=UPI00374937B1